MARPTKPETDKRSMRLPAPRVTAAEYSQAQKRADSVTLSLTDFMRDLALHGKVKPRKTKLESSFLVELNRIGVNLNQIAHAQNIGRDNPASLQHALNELKALMTKIDAKL